MIQVTISPDSLTDDSCPECGKAHAELSTTIIIPGFGYKILHLDCARRFAKRILRRVEEEEYP